MIMPRDVAVWLQFNLACMALLPDDMSLLAFSSGKIDSYPDDTNARWQLAVDMIYRCLISGLLHIDSPSYVEGQNGVYEFARILASVNPFSLDLEEVGSMHWLGPLLHTSKLCDGLIHKHGIRGADDPLNTALINDIEDMFDQNGVGWHEEPLISIRSS